MTSEKLKLKLELLIEESKLTQKEITSSKKKYDLGEIGRKKLNQKIYKKVFRENERTLKPEDILGAIHILIKFKEGRDFKINLIENFCKMDLIIIDTTKL